MPEAQGIHEVALIRDFAIIMAVAGGALLVFRRLHQPAVLGYLFAGLIVGPFTLPLFGIHAPVANVDRVRLLADLGLVLLLFALGMEFGWQRIRSLGLRIVLIGAIEISFMIAIGYQLGIFFGWTGTESLFLGAALSISSSAIIVKMLRDTGTLMTPHGKLIAGMLIVEDFAAVLLLSVLAGVATSGTAEFSEILERLLKLGLFLVSVLALATIFAPRLINFAARFNSRETLLIVSLALCFGLALVAEELGISAAAGAFLIGTVLGDTDHSEELANTMAPVRDIFAALFFVSIGMLIDISLVGQFIVPAMIVSTVFVIGKTTIDTLATFMLGSSGRVSLSAGLGMSQMGEFSLAIVKVGADKNAVGTFLYPVVIVSAAITAFIYPVIFKSSESLANLLERRSPKALKQYVFSISSWIMTSTELVSMRGDTSASIKHSTKIVMINLGVIAVLIGVGTFALGYVDEVANIMNVDSSLMGLGISVSVLALCVPPAIFVWRSMQRMADDLADTLEWKGVEYPVLWGKSNLRDVLRDTILFALIIVVAIWSIPFFSRLVLIDRVLTPVPIFLLVGFAALAWRGASKIHHVLVAAFTQTFLGDSHREPNPTAGLNMSDDDD